MADASSSDTTSDCCNECFSDITSEKSEFVVVGRKPCPSHRRSKGNFLQKLLIRETRGCLSAHNYASEERLFTTVPKWRHLSLLHVIPKSALEAGHIVMGLTQCGQFLLTYTYMVDVSSNTSLFKYLLHWWAFTPNHVARKVAEVTLFGNYSIYRELNIVISQWPMERNKLVIHGLCTNFLHLQSTDRAYLTITTVPSLENCKDCLKVAASYEEEELAANWDCCVRCNCLQHGLTVHTTYEVISPYPKFRAKVCLNYWNHVVVNTGNFLHVLRVDLNIPKSKNQRTCDKPNTSDSIVPDTIPLDMSDVEETDYSTRTERYESSDEKVGTPECPLDRSPKCESSLEHDFLDEAIKLDPRLGRDLPLNTSSSNQSDCVCDINSKSTAADALNVKLCECSDMTEQCKCRNNSSSSPVSQRPGGGVEQTAISVRDKILQDFCEDTSQELNIGSDLITLVKHPSCSPRSTPQRLPADLKTMTAAWSLSILTPPSDILRTRNSESSHRTQIQRTNSSGQQSSSSSSQSTASDNSVASINSPLQSVSISSPSSSYSSRLMSPPIVTRSFRHPSPRKRSNLHSPPPVVNPSQSTRTTRASHKLILEAEKAYEFTDETQETTCEKLSSFRKRRLADKKYEFCDETEDAENIVPFKHIRDQFRHRGACSIHLISSSPAISPAVLPNGRRHWFDSDQSESDELNLAQDIANDLSNPESAEKNVLRPLNQNQLSNGSVRDRDRIGKCCPNFSPLVPKNNLQYPSIKCTARFKRSYIELDDEMISVITDVEDEETGGYVSYQCVLPMLVHGSGYVQMQMISNSKAEKLIVPCVSITQLSFDIETFSHHIADWICTRFKKKYWHCSDYDIEMIDVCALTGDIICLHIMKIQASELCSQTQCTQERKQYEVGCKFTWNIETSQYRITDVLPMEEVKPESWKPTLTNVPNFRSQLWNPTRRLATQLREKIQQPYAHTVRFLHNEMSLAGESITKLTDLDNLVQFYLTPIERTNDALIE